MKSTVLMVAMVLCAFTASAQKVKIKKGEIQFDGTSVAKMEKANGGMNAGYIFSDLNGTVLFNAGLSGKTPEGNPLADQILMLTAPNGNVKEFLTKDIKVSFTLSSEKLMCDYVLNCGANLITPQGVDLEKVNDYFQTSDRSITSAIDEQMKSMRDEMNKEDALLAAANIKIYSNGSVMKGSDKIGLFGLRNNTKTSEMQYVILDKNGDLIGSTNIAYPSASTTNLSRITTPVIEKYTLTTFDGQKLSYFAIFDSKKASVTDDVADRLLKKLYYAGYKFDELSVKEMAKEKSKNLYEVQGYVIDKNGDKIEGLVSIEFEPMIQSGGLMLDLTNYGGSAKLKISEDKTKTYNAKDRITVVAGDRKFVGFPGIEALDGAKLYEVVAEKAGNMVLYSVNYNVFLLKMANQDKVKLFSEDGVFVKKKPETMQKELDEYVGCPELNNEDYQLETKDGLIKLLEDYADKCK
ncbi:hypothetical protein AGMMS49525_08440 [Bacteroidia bacterium]|nr:hypothetical protein AGMMS49525_08440 [Bacteroidia bacterium]